MSSLRTAIISVGLILVQPATMGVRQAQSDWLLGALSEAAVRIGQQLFPMDDLKPGYRLASRVWVIRMRIDAEGSDRTDFWMEVEERHSREHHATIRYASVSIYDQLRSAASYKPGDGRNYTPQPQIVENATHQIMWREWSLGEEGCPDLWKSIARLKRMTVPALTSAVRLVDADSLYFASLSKDGNSLRFRGLLQPSRVETQTDSLRAWSGEAKEMALGCTRRLQGSTVRYSEGR